MRKRARFFLAMMCVMVLVGCGTSDKVEKVENNISQPAEEESITSEENGIVSAAGDAQEPVRDTQLVVDELSQSEDTDDEGEADSVANDSGMIDNEKIANGSFPLAGVTMEVVENSDTSVTVRITNDTDKDIQCGDMYHLEMYVKETGEWQELDTVNDIIFNDVAYEIKKDFPYKKTVDFEQIYGKLEVGRYRIVKTVMDFRRTGDYTDYVFTAEFCIK